MNDDNLLNKDAYFTKKKRFTEGSFKTKNVLKIIIYIIKVSKQLDVYQQGNNALCTWKSKPSIMMKLKVTLNRKILSNIISGLKVSK